MKLMMLGYLAHGYKKSHPVKSNRSFSQWLALLFLWYTGGNLMMLPFSSIPCFYYSTEAGVFFFPQKSCMHSFLVVMHVTNTTQQFWLIFKFTWLVNGLAVSLLEEYIHPFMFTGPCLVVVCC